jgi:C-terminal processing protease CtpA/Prc
MKLINIMLLLFLSTGAAAQIPARLSASDKVYGLSKFWQEVNYNFIYLDKVNRKDWDNRYKELITVVQNTKNDYEYFKEMEKFCALLKDGHTNVYAPPGIKEMYSDFGEYQIFTKNIGGKAIIIRTNKSKKDELPVGSEIIEVNGKPTEEYIKENITPYISSSTSYVVQDWGILRMFRGVEGDTYQIKIKKPDGKIIPLTLTHKAATEKELYPPVIKKELLDFKWYPNQTAYVSLNSFEDEKIDSLFTDKLPELYKAKALIIDLRKNGGGDGIIGRNILQYLTNDTLLYSAKTTTRNHIATYKAWGKWATAKDTLVDKDAKKYLLAYEDKYYYQFEYAPDTIRLNAQRIVIPTVILLGHSTASAAEDFLIYADNQKHITKIGENSFGSTGQPFMFELAGGMWARVCTKKDTYANGKEFVGYGIKPDIEVTPSVNDYIKQKDTALDRAIEFLKKKRK